MRTILAVAILLLLGAGAMMGAGNAQPARPSAEAGAELAARWCAACHVVSSGGAGTDAAPSFPFIARMRSPDELKLFLAEPHARPMRGFNLTRREIDDVVAYIETLEQQAGAR